VRDAQRGQPHGAQGRPGIGLALAKSLVHLQEEASRRRAAAPHDKRRTRLVDDDEAAVELLALMLEGAGYETSKAKDAPSALAGVEGWAPDVVILDIGLPDLHLTKPVDADRLCRALESLEVRTTVS
ncbi:MAG TPA: response regulator, partial [Polyangiaceae bacterium]